MHRERSGESPLVIPGLVRVATCPLADVREVRYSCGSPIRASMRALSSESSHDVSKGSNHAHARRQVPGPGAAVVREVVALPVRLPLEQPIVPADLRDAVSSRSARGARRRIGRTLVPARSRLPGRRRGLPGRAPRGSPMRRTGNALVGLGGQTAEFARPVDVGVDHPTSVMTSLEVIGPARPRTVGDDVEDGGRTARRA